MQTMPHNADLVNHLLQQIATQREGFGQERVYLRAVGLVLAEILAQGTHCVTDLLRALGLNEEDWTGWYRLLSRPNRFQFERLSQKLFEQILAQASAQDLVVVGGDLTSVPRTSKRMEGVGWGKCPRNPPFRTGIHLAQRFFHGAWFTPMERGFSRAIPLRFQPAFTEKAARKQQPAQKEQAAGADFLEWVRQQLTAAGRGQQTVLGLFDGSYDRPDFWKRLPPNTVALVRTAKNRALTHFPPPYSGKGRRSIYGAPAPAPQNYLSSKSGWHTLNVAVRGNSRRMDYRVEGPFLRRGMSQVPLFLICVGGQCWEKGNRNKRRNPVFYLVNAVEQEGQWVMPLPVKTLLKWAWQRWELEVVHRELKTGFGLGDKQASSPHAAVSSVQWSAWAYANVMLAGYRSYGLAGGVARRDAWRKHHPRRWTLMSLLQHYRAELAAFRPFRGLFSPSAHNWPEMEQALLPQVQPPLAATFFRP
jgi:hypothetical protein